MTLRPQRLIQDSLVWSAERHPHSTAVVSGAERLSYAELLDRAARLAQAFQGLGVRRGDRVAVYMENSNAAAVSVFATLLAGGIFVVINPQTKADKLRYVLSDCEATALVTDSLHVNVATAVAGGVPSVAHVICSDLPPSSSALAFEELVAAAGVEPERPRTIPLDLAALIYTSGSTGAPKGVMMTHQGMVFAAESIAEYLRLEGGDRIVNVLPLAFDYGLYQLLMSVRVGAALCLERSFAFPGEVLKRVVEEKATVFPGVPTVFATLFAMAERKAFTLPSITRVTNTGAALPSTFHAGLREIFPNALVYRMYGLTECKRVSYLEPELLDVRPESVGKAIPGTETLVLGPNKTPVEPGETGILYVRGPHVMVGYWRQPELTQTMIVEGPLPGERMLCTQDYFTIDEEGFLYFIGRSDDIIKTRGEKVSPAEVENVIYNVPGVREAAVIGVPDELLGEAVWAFVSVREGFELSGHEIIAACRAGLESLMVPTEVVVLAELPKSSNGKIDKHQLLEQSRLGAESART